MDLQTNYGQFGNPEIPSLPTCGLNGTPQIPHFKRPGEKENKLMKYAAKSWGNMSYPYLHLVDFDGFHVGKYTSPMDPMGCGEWTQLPYLNPIGPLQNRNDRAPKLHLFGSIHIWSPPVEIQMWTGGSSKVSKLLILWMVIQPLIGNPYGYINSYYWVGWPSTIIWKPMGV